MTPDSITLQAATRQSWDTIVAKGDALKFFDFVEKQSPEILEAHQKVVAATFEADFDPVLAEKIVSDGKRDFHRHLFDDTKTFRTDLARFLRTRFGP